MRSTINAPEMPSARIYRLCVESHLPAEGLTLPGLLACATGYDPAGRPTTSLLFQAAGQAQMLRILESSFDPNLTLVSVEWVREPSG